MQIKGSPPPKPQSQVSTSGPAGAAAGADKAKTTAGAASANKAKSAAGPQAPAASDSYLPAPKPQGGQNTSFVGQKINVGDVKAGRMGCCLPEPPPLGPIGMTPAQFAKLQASIAKSDYNETTRKAGEDGKITDKEQRGVNAKGQEWKKAEGRADVESAKESHATARKEALKDGHISPAEEMRLAMAEMKIWGLEQKLKGLEANDRRMDKQDEIWNNIDGPGGMPKPGSKDPLESWHAERRDKLAKEIFDTPGPSKDDDPRQLRRVDDPAQLRELKEGMNLWMGPLPKIPDYPILPQLYLRPIFCRND